MNNSFIKYLDVTAKGPDALSLNDEISQRGRNLRGNITCVSIALGIIASMVWVGMHWNPFWSPYCCAMGGMVFIPSLIGTVMIPFEYCFRAKRVKQAEWIQKIFDKFSKNQVWVKQDYLDLKNNSAFVKDEMLVGLLYNMNQGELPLAIETLGSAYIMETIERSRNAEVNFLDTVRQVPDDRDSTRWKEMALKGVTGGVNSFIQFVIKERGFGKEWMKAHGKVLGLSESTTYIKNEEDSEQSYWVSRSFINTGDIITTLPPRVYHGFVALQKAFVEGTSYNQEDLLYGLDKSGLKGYFDDFIVA